MAYVSFIEQLTSSISLSILAIISTGILGLLLVYTIVGRLFFTSKTKVSPTNNLNTKKSQSNTTSNNKTKETKAKKAAQSDEIEIVTSTKKSANEKKHSKTTIDNTNLDKKQPVVLISEVEQTSVADVEISNDQEDEGQWVSRNNKQIRNRHKDKIETSNHKQTAVAAAENINEKESNSALNQIEQPIEVYQLLPTNENPYTINDNWWKQALNTQQTFSVDDIGEWPEYEQDERYVVQVKRVLPNKKQ